MDTTGAPNFDNEVFYTDVQPTRRAVSISSVDSEPIVRAASEASHASSSSTSSLNPKTKRQFLIQNESDDVLTAEIESKIPIERVSEAHIARITSISVASKSCVAEATNDALVMDIGTVLCLSDGTALGRISSILGPVKQAFYVLTSTLESFDNEVRAHLIKEGTQLHYDLGCQKIIFDPYLQCNLTKGTDASYINDEELPGHVRPDFSDDEKELEWKRQKRRRLEEADDAESISSDEVQEDVEWSKIAWADESASEAVQNTGEFGVVVPQWIARAAPPK